MAVAKEPLIAEQHPLDVSAAADQPTAGTPTAATPPPESRGTRFLSVLARNMHYLTFIPLILVSVLASVNLLIAAVVASGLVTCLIVLGYVCHRAGLVKVSTRAEEPHGSCIHTKGRWHCITLTLTHTPASSTFDDNSHQVWPKPFDIFNWSLYTSMIFLAIFATDWLSLYISLLTNAANAAFMWVSCP